MLQDCNTSAGIYADSMRTSTIQIVYATSTIQATTTPVTVVSPITVIGGGYTMGMQEVLLIFGVFLFILSVPFWEKVFSLTRDRY
jgi:hypothetical protein